MNFVPMAEAQIIPILGSKVFPGIKDEVPNFKRIDVRCDFNRDLLRKQMPSAKASEIRFNEGGRVDLDISTSCGVYTDATAMGGKFNWKPYETIYFRFVGEYKLAVDAFEQFKKMGIKVEEAKVEFKEFKIFAKGSELPNVDNQKEALTKLLDTSVFDQLPDYKQMGVPMPVDMKQPPIIPYPMFAACLGLQPEEPVFDIEDGFVRLSYDFSVGSASSACLFDIIHDGRPDINLEQAERVQRRAKKMPSVVEKGGKALEKATPLFKKMKKMADQTGMTDKI